MQVSSSSEDSPLEGSQKKQDQLDILGMQASIEGAKNLKNISKVLNTIDDSIIYVDKSFKSLINTMGRGESYAAGMGKMLEKTYYAINKVGGTRDDAVKLQLEMLEVTGRAAMISDKQAADLYTAAKVSGVASKALAQGFIDSGKNLSEVSEEMLKVREVAQSIGANAQMVSKLVVANLDKLNRFNFQGGVEGLAKMAASSQVLGVSMESTLEFADSLFDPEKAIEMAAEFQRMGVQSEDLKNPLKLMYMAEYETEKLQEKIGESMAQYVGANNKITGDGVRMMKYFASQGMMTRGELEKLAIRTKDLQNKMSKISFTGLNIDEDTQKLVANIAQMGEGGVYEIQTTDASGQIVSQSIEQFVRSFGGDQEALRKAILDQSAAGTTASEKMSNIGEGQLDTLSLIKRQNDLLEQAVGFTVSAGKLGPEMLKAAEELNKFVTSPLIDRLGSESNLGKGIDNSTEDLKRALKEFKDSGGKDVEGLLGELTKIGTGLGGTVLTELGGVSEEYLKPFKDLEIVQEIVKGITENLPALKEGGAEAVYSILSGINDAIDKYIIKQGGGNDGGGSQVPVPGGGTNNQTGSQVPVPGGGTNNQTGSQVPVPGGGTNNQTGSQVPVPGGGGNQGSSQDGGYIGTNLEQNYANAFRETKKDQEEITYKGTAEALDEYSASPSLSVTIVADKRTKDEQADKGLTTSLAEKEIEKFAENTEVTPPLSDAKEIGELKPSPTEENVDLTKNIIEKPDALTKAYESLDTSKIQVEEDKGGFLSGFKDVFSGIGNIGNVVKNAEGLMNMDPETIATMIESAGEKIAPDLLKISEMTDKGEQSKALQELMDKLLTAGNALEVLGSENKFKGKLGEGAGLNEAVTAGLKNIEGLNAQNIGPLVKMLEDNMGGIIGGVAGKVKEVAGEDTVLGKIGSKFGFDPKLIDEYANMAKDMAEATDLDEKQIAGVFEGKTLDVMGAMMGETAETVYPPEQEGEESLTKSLEQKAAEEPQKGLTTSITEGQLDKFPDVTTMKVGKLEIDESNLSVKIGESAAKPEMTPAEGVKTAVAEVKGTGTTNTEMTPAEGVETAAAESQATTETTNTEMTPAEGVETAAVESQTTTGTVETGIIPEQSNEGETLSKLENIKPIEVLSLPIEEKGLMPIKPTLSPIPTPEGEEEKQTLRERVKSGVGKIKDKFKKEKVEETPAVGIEKIEAEKTEESKKLEGEETLTEGKEEKSKDEKGSILGGLKSLASGIGNIGNIKENVSGMMNMDPETIATIIESAGEKIAPDLLEISKIEDKEKQTTALQELMDKTLTAGNVMDVLGSENKFKGKLGEGAGINEAVTAGLKNIEGLNAENVGPLTEMLNNNMGTIIDSAAGKVKDVAGEGSFLGNIASKFGFDTKQIDEYANMAKDIAESTDLDAEQISGVFNGETLDVMGSMYPQYEGFAIEEGYTPEPELFGETPETFTENVEGTTNLPEQPISAGIEEAKLEQSQSVAEPTEGTTEPQLENIGVLKVEKLEVADSNLAVEINEGINKEQTETGVAKPEITPAEGVETAAAETQATTETTNTEISPAEGVESAAVEAQATTETTNTEISPAEGVEAAQDTAESRYQKIRELEEQGIVGEPTASTEGGFVFNEQVNEENTTLPKLENIKPIESPLLPIDDKGLMPIKPVNLEAGITETDLNKTEEKEKGGLKGFFNKVSNTAQNIKGLVNQDPEVMASLISKAGQEFLPELNKVAGMEGEDAQSKGFKDILKQSPGKILDILSSENTFEGKIPEGGINEALTAAMSENKELLQGTDVEGVTSLINKNLGFGAEPEDVGLATTLAEKTSGIAEFAGLGDFGNISDFIGEGLGNFELDADAINEYIQEGISGGNEEQGTLTIPEGEFTQEDATIEPTSEYTSESVMEGTEPYSELAEVDPIENTEFTPEPAEPFTYDNLYNVMGNQGAQPQGAVGTGGSGEPISILAKIEITGNPEYAKLLNPQALQKTVEDMFLKSAEKPQFAQKVNSYTSDKSSSMGWKR